MKKWVLKPDPGRLPLKPPPKIGQRLSLLVAGLPPYKDTHFSIRNPKHRHHDRFVSLRAEATRAMAGREWFSGPVGLEMIVHAPSLERSLLEYVGGIMDTLDGSHGVYFTYLPIVYQDDCQVALSGSQYRPAETARYEVRLAFLGDRP